MLKRLAELASELDRRGYVDHANTIDALIKKLAAGRWAVYVSWPTNDYQLGGSEIHQVYDSREEAESVAAKLREGGKEAEVEQMGRESGEVLYAKDQGVCEMCGEFKPLHNAKMNDTGEDAKLCKGCKKQYAYEESSAKDGKICVYCKGKGQKGPLGDTCGHCDGSGYEIEMPEEYVDQEDEEQ